MPQKAQFLLQLAQAAARETRQQAALPQVAVNVWDTLTGSHAPPLQQQPGSGSRAQHKAEQQRSVAASAAASDRLSSGLGLLHISKSLAGQDAAPHHYPAHLLAQAHLAGSHWGQHPHLTGSIAADTAALYDTSSHTQHQQQLAGLPRQSGGLGPLQSCLPLRPAAPGLGSLDANNRSGSSGSLGPGGMRKPRYNNSISLNKQIMNTHSARELHTIVRSKGAGFDFFNISSAIARVPKLVGPAGGVQNDSTAKALVDDLASLMASNINTFDARGLANSAWAFGKLKYAPNQKLPQLIAAAAITKMDVFSAQNLSNLLWSFVYLHHRDEALMAAVAKKVVSKVTEFKPQELANVVWAFASMDHYEPHLMDVVGARALALVDQFKEQELSNVVWAFAKLHHYEQGLFAHLLAAVKAKLPHFLPQGVSNIAWALATAGHRDEPLFEQLLAHCVSDIGSYDVQGLSNLLWACATLGHRDPTFLQAVLQECTARIERMSSQNLSNALWACAALGHADSRMLGTWAEAVLHKLDMFEPQGLSNTAWAFAKLGFSSPVLFEALAEAALGKLDAFTAQGLSNTAWAYATMGHYHPALVQQLAEQVARQVSAFNAQNCSMSAWAFATLRHYHPALFDALLEQLAAQLPAGVEPQNIANSLWAFARAGHPLGVHTEPLVAAAKALLPQMNQQELCNTAWALGVLGQLDRDTWQQFCNCLGNVQGLTPEGVHQAFHAQLMLHSQLAREAGVPLASLPAEQLPTLPEPLHSHAHYMWLTSAVDVHISKLQADVSAALLVAGIPNSMEWLTDDGLFSIDIAFQVDGQPVAVEVDGSHHYTNSTPHIPLSEVLVRRRLLQDRGWKVVNIGYLDWEMLPDDQQTKAAALLQLVASELGPNTNWQQVGPPAGCQESSQLAQQQQQMMRRQSQTNGNGSTATAWGSAAAAAVAAAVGGDSCSGLVVQRGAFGGYSTAAVQGGLGGYGMLDMSGLTAANTSQFGGVSSSNSSNSAWGLGLGGWGGIGGPAWGANTASPWVPASSSAVAAAADAAQASMLHRLQAQQQQQQVQRMWESGYAAGAAAAAAAAAAGPSQRMSPEHLVVGGPTRASSACRGSGSSSSTNVAAIGEGRASLASSPGSSKAGSCCDEQAAGPTAAAGNDLRTASVAGSAGSFTRAASSQWVESPNDGGIRMPAFTWGDPLTSSIWGPAGGQA